MATPTEEERAFIRSIEAKPFDPLQRLIFADYLDEQGDNRAELFRMQAEMQVHAGLRLDIRKAPRKGFKVRGLSWATNNERMASYASRRRELSGLPPMLVYESWFLPRVEQPAHVGRAVR